jgi:hypothetical protein
VKGVLILSLAFCGCAVPTTRFTYAIKDGQTVTVEMPKELEAKMLKVSIDAKGGVATIEAQEISTKSVGVITAQGKREAAVAKSVSEGAAQGVVQGAGKALVP